MKKTIKYWELHKEFFNEEFSVLNKEVQFVIVNNENSEEAQTLLKRIDIKIAEKLENN